MNAKKYEILKGPGRGKLIDAFKYTYDKDFTHRISFGVALGFSGRRNDPTTSYIAARIKNMEILGMEHLDESGKSYRIYGICEADLSVNVLSEENYTKYQFEASYNTSTHKGIIEFQECG